MTSFPFLFNLHMIRERKKNHSSSTNEHWSCICHARNAADTEKNSNFFFIKSTRM